MSACVKCGKEAIARGLCWAHYSRARRDAARAKARHGLLTRNEATRLCGFKSPRSISKLVEQGKLTPAAYAAGRPLYDPADLAGIKPRRYRAPEERARSRVARVANLRPYRDIILADWREGDEHWRWIANAPVEEIVGWAEGIAEYQ